MEDEANSYKGLPLGRILGFPVRLSWSWLLLAVLITVLYGEGPYGAFFVLGLLLSVLLHELGHAVASRELGTGVKGITLELLGGYTEMERDAPRPGVEAAVSLAGPAASSLVALAAAAVAAGSAGATEDLARNLAVSNAVIAIFNALPGLPLDGGRALHALIWSTTGDRYRGQRIAGWAGTALAVACVVAAVALATISWIAAAFTLFMAGSIGLGGVNAVKYAKHDENRKRLDLDQLVRPIVGVPSGTTVEEAHRHATEGTVFGVLDPEGRLWAVVPEAEDATVPVDRRGSVEIDSLARLVGDYRSVPTGLTGDEVLRAVEADPVGDYLVTAGEDVVGILRVADVNRILEEPTRRSST